MFLDIRQGRNGPSPKRCKLPSQVRFDLVLQITLVVAIILQDWMEGGISMQARYDAKRNAQARKDQGNYLSSPFALHSNSNFPSRTNLPSSLPKGALYLNRPN